MSFERNIEICELFNKFGWLLTKNQQEILHDYFNLDIGLSEIAEIRNITRQAVKNIIDTCVEKIASIKTKVEEFDILRGATNGGI
ncbi:MAG: hypothetical protein FWD32_01910 [Firmicutes bacterium]|nr:hypothetical protein [Bacillota bacterium]